MFTVGQLEYFLEVAKQLSFTKAAETFYTDQTTISKSIAKLERDLDVKLFHRTTRKIALTEAGNILQKEGAAWLEMREAISNDVKKADRSRVASLDVVPFNFFNREIQDLMLDFHRAYPEIDLNYDRVPLSNLHEIAVQVRKRQADIGIVPSFLISMQDKDRFLFSPYLRTLCAW